MPTKIKAGRPASDKPLRYPIRHRADQMAAWRIAAATCGLTLPDWIATVLEREAAAPNHVAPLRREVSRAR